jgi:ATP-dependent Zn protease
MEDQSLLRLLLSWFPMLLLIAVWIYFMSRGSYGKKQQKVILEYLEEMRRTNQNLDRIATALEKR